MSADQRSPVAPEAVPPATVPGAVPTPPVGVRTHHVLSSVLFALMTTAPVVVVLGPLSSAASVTGDPVAIGLSLAIVVYASVRVTGICWSGRPRWAAALFWAFSYVWLGLAALAQTASGFNPFSTVFDLGTQRVALGVILLGFVAFDVAHRLMGRSRPAAGAELPAVRWRLSPRRVVVLGVVTVLATPALVVALGGPVALFGNRYAVTLHLQSSGFYTETSHVLGGLLTSLANVLPFAAAMALVCLLRAEPGRFRRSMVVLLVALAASNVLLNNPISNPRNWFLAIAIAFVLATGLTRRPSFKVAFVALFLAGATVVFPYADAFRTADVGVQSTTRTGSTPVDFLVGKTDYGAVTDVAVTVLRVEEQGHTMGRQLLGAVAFWVPRAVWTDKPTNTAELLATQIRFPNPNLDTPLWAEGFIDFGPWGTFALLGLFGLLVARVDDVVERAEIDPRRHADVTFPMAVSFVGYESFLLRGSLLQAMAKIVTVLLVFLVLARREPPDGAAPPRGRRVGRPGRVAG